jgi:hypothetical protein
VIAGRCNAAVPTYTGLRFYLLPQKKTADYRYEKGWATWDKPFNRQVGYHARREDAEAYTSQRNDAEYVRRTAGRITEYSH